MQGYDFVQFYESVFFLLLLIISRAYNYLGVSGFGFLSLLFHLSRP